MSQYPPGGTSGYPPPNFPPGMPPGFGGQGYSMPSASRMSGAAITSFVCGLILCVPFLTGLVAAITGIVGISATGNPAVRGRGLAIAGLILGLLNIGLWLAFSGGMLVFLHGAKPERDFAKTYITNLAAGNITQCVQSSTPNVTADQLTADSNTMKSWGALTDTLIFGFNLNNQNGQVNGSVSGVCTFVNGRHQFLMMISRDSTGQLKADSFLWQN
jgi:hypothetical protein